MNRWLGTPVSLTKVPVTVSLMQPSSFPIPSSCTSSWESNFRARSGTLSFLPETRPHEHEPVEGEDTSSTAVRIDPTHADPPSLESLILVLSMAETFRASVPRIATGRTPFSPGLKEFGQSRGLMSRDTSTGGVVSGMSTCTDTVTLPSTIPSPTILRWKVWSPPTASAGGEMATWNAFSEGHGTSEYESGVVTHPAYPGSSTRRESSRMFCFDIAWIMETISSAIREASPFGFISTKGPPVL